MVVWIHSPFDNLPHEGFRCQRYWLMAEAFASAGHRVVYWTSDFNHGTKAKRCLAELPAAHPQIELRLVPTPAYTKNVCFARIRSHRTYARRLARELPTAETPALVISATPALGAAAVLMDYARRVGARFAVDIQDAWPETFYRLLPRGFAWFGKLLFSPMARTARRLYREADLVTGVSARYRDVCGRDDFRLFYHGIRPSGSRPHRSVSHPVARMVYVGNLGDGYDLETVVRAVAAESRLSLDIAGKGPRESALQTLVGNLGVADRVRFHGYLSADVLSRLLSESDVGVVPMRDDSWVGLPYKLGDYLVAGLPVVSSLHGECGALLEGEGLGKCYDWGSQTSLLAALDGLPTAEIVLPDRLRADLIYPAYVAQAVSVLSTPV